MKTKKLITGLLLLAFSTWGYSQARGNYNYRDVSNYSAQPRMQIAPSSSLANLESIDYHTFSIKGLYNCTADSYLAIFTITQVGLTQTEAETLVRAKTDSIKSALKEMGADVEIFVDMISFMPIYEVEVTKKLFSEDTYNEIPKGFEIKKNLHFRYKDASVLEDLVTVCASQEVYDLVRVDYFIDDLAAKKAEMIAKAEGLLTAEIARYKRLLGEDFDHHQVQVADGFRMTYPLEQYQTYTAFCSNTMNVVHQGGTVVQQDKTTSEFYMPIIAKGFDFVTNASIIRPVVQIEYEIVMRFSPEPVQPVQPQVITEKEIEVQKEIYFVTPDAQITKLDL